MNKPFVVLEEWESRHFMMRLVTDGKSIWIEYLNMWREDSDWSVDDGFESCADYVFDDLVPVFI